MNHLSYSDQTIGTNVGKPVDLSGRASGFCVKFLLAQQFIMYQFYTDILERLDGHMERCALADQIEKGFTLVSGQHISALRNQKFSAWNILIRLLIGLKFTLGISYWGLSSW